MTVWACHRAPVGVEMPRAVSSAAVRRADFNNVSGLPAITLPLHSSDLGLPIGMMFGAGYGKEGVLFRLAGQLEQAVDWSDQHPAHSLWNQ